MEKRYTKCVFCDGGCAIEATVDGDEWSVAPADPTFPAICSKARMVDEYRLHPDRIVYPLKNVGARGEAVWERVSWDQALDEIAVRLQAVIDEYGAEAFAVSEMPGNHGFGGVTRRFMNRIGSPNYVTAMELCMGNTAQVHRAVYGGFASGDWGHADCIVYFGQDRDGERWPGEYLKLRAALDRGAPLIDVDPRETATARLADYHLRIRYGTDAALVLSWINVIVDEGLYDAAFVEEWCTGFEELRERAAEYAPERVAEICGIDVDAIRETARTYARAQAAIIPWGVVPDMQVNSTSLIQAQCILRAICGFLGESEFVSGPVANDGLSNAEFARFDWLSPEQRAKQLGAVEHPLLTFRAAELYREANARIGLTYEPDLLAQSCACDPSSLFAAMRGEGPYPVKAFFAVANNTVMSYANQPGIVAALMNQDLVVVFEHWMTPTAQLADYVLPGDMWAERDTMGPAVDIAPIATCAQAFRPRAGECRSWYDVVRGLAVRMGMEDAFPWANEHELYDARLAPIGLTWDGLVAQAPAPAAAPLAAPGSHLTPSGKVELASSVLAAFGFDPLPHYDEPRDPGVDAAGEDAFPYVIFAGYRERASYNTNLHQMPALREREPEPQFFINPEDAAREGIAEGRWCAVETSYGRVELMAHLDDAQSAGTLRVPHGWWKPEAPQGVAAGLSAAALYNDGVLFPDEVWNLDGPQGVPNLRGGIHARVTAI